MKVLMAVSNFYPALDLGGLVQTPWELAQILIQMGHTVDVVTSNLVGSARKLTNQTTFRTEKGINITYLNSIWSYRASGITPGIFNFCKRLSNYDIIHIFGLRDFITTVVALKAQSLGIPYVVEPMGMYRRILRSFTKKLLYDSIIGGKVLRGAAKIIATSEFEKKELILNQKINNKVVLRINGIDISFFKHSVSSGDFRLQISINVEPPLLLFLGRIIAKKNVDWLIDILVNLPEAHLAIVGDYTEEPTYYQALTEQVKQLSLEDRVHFTGAVYGEKKLSIFADADLFCLPSQSENYGNAVAEAIAAGTVVAITDRCGIAPLIEDSGIVIPYNYQDYKQAVVRIIRDKKLLQKLKQNCADVRQKLSWDLPSQKMVKIYQEIIAEPSK